MRHPGEGVQLEPLRMHARALAARLGTAAAAATTVGRERAILRLFGVAGLDGAGHPLAARVVDRFLDGHPERLAGGVALPFGLVMSGSRRTPRDLALEIAAGTVDLGEEAAALADPRLRAAAEAEVQRLARAALDRIDANRTVRRELVDLLGDPGWPWVGVSLRSPAIVDALDEAAVALDAGAGLLAVGVPPARELAERAAKRGQEVAGWRPDPASRGGLDTPDPEQPPVPTGSQRALAVLRRSMDELAARRRGYARILTDVHPLGAPEQAVVAAFERVDVVVADPIREIASGRVGPDRALADHAFAHRLLARAGARVVIPAGPLVVGPDLATGMPSNGAVRSGRALALQLLAVELALQAGVADASLVAGALPDWITDEPGSPARAVAEVALREALFPGLGLAFVEPAGGGDDSRESLAVEPGLAWCALVAALLPHAAGTQLVLRRAGGPVGLITAQARAAADVAAGLRVALEPGGLTGPAAEHASAVARAASATLELLDRDGWGVLFGTSYLPEAAADGVAVRTDGLGLFAAS